MEEYKDLRPFQVWLINQINTWGVNNFPFVESDFDSLTNYGMMQKLMKALNDVINNENAVEQNMSSLYQAFIDLQTYINNLDLQDEVNNKLDEMAESGELEEIMADYLNSKAIFGFDNVASMKTATNLINGSYAKTLGYYNINDNGGATYKIRTITNEDIIDEGSIIALNDNTLVAELIIKDRIINVKQFGAKGNSNYFNENDHKLYVDSEYTSESNDDTNSIQNAINYCFSNNTKNINTNAYTLLFPTANYKINHSLYLSNNIDVDGKYSIIIPTYNFNGTYLFATNVNPTDTTTWIMATPHRHAYFKDILPTDYNKQNIGLLLLGDTREVKGILASYMGWVIHTISEYIDSVTIKDINVNAPSGGEYQLKFTGAGDGLLIDNCHFYGDKSMCNSGGDTYCVGTNLFINAIQLNNHNGSITNCINGRIELNVGNYDINNFHCEQGQILVKNCETSISNSILWENPANYSPIYVINTNSVKSGFACNLENNDFYVLQREEHDFTVERADIDISTSSGSVSINNCVRRMFSSNTGEQTRFRTLATINTPNGIYYMIRPIQNFLDGLYYDDYSIYDEMSSRYSTSNFSPGTASETETPYNFPLVETTYTAYEVFDFNRLLGRKLGEGTITPTNTSIIALRNLHENNNTYLYIEKVLNNTVYYVFVPLVLGVRIYDFGDNLGGLPWKTRDTALTFNSDISYLEKKDKYVKMRATSFPSLGTWKKSDEITNSGITSESTWIKAFNTTNGTPTWVKYIMDIVS